LLSALTSESWESELSTVPEKYQPIACIQIRAETLGRQSLCLSEQDLGTLLSLFLNEDVHPIDFGATQREAMEELSRQWSGLTATALKEELGEISFQVSLETEPRLAPQPSEQRLLCARSGDRSVTAVLVVDPAIIAAMQNPQAAAVPGVPTAVSQPESGGITELLREGNLELLMDVELAVMLRFGSRVATLHEVLNLATGAVLELDREIQEPVDLVLNDRLIARGEVVVIDGNYGLRVSEVASPQQRMNSL
jgi:flagellar motor switch protein FliN/FliY